MVVNVSKAHAMKTPHQLAQVAGQGIEMKNILRDIAADSLE